jgi:DNA integrity scanning protein DisA with diadenylate cyclase activity
MTHGEEETLDRNENFYKQYLLQMIVDFQNEIKKTEAELGVGTSTFDRGMLTAYEDALKTFKHLMEHKYDSKNAWSYSYDLGK